MGRRFGSKLGFAILQAVADGIEIVELANRKPSALLTYGLEDLRCLEAIQVRRRIQNTTRRLRIEGLIEQKKSNAFDGYRLTGLGNDRLRTMTVKPPPLPSGWWTIVSFDIPISQTKIRNRFRKYLKRLGFKPMQQSVWCTDRAWTSCLDGYYPESVDPSWVAVFRAEQLK